MFQKLADLATGPGNVMYQVATALFYPILLLLAAALVYNVFEFGRFTLEMFRRDRQRSTARIELAASTARNSLASGKPGQAAQDLTAINGNWLVAQFTKLLAAGSSDMSRARLLKMLNETESLATRRLDRTRVWIRLGPIIGLITTLIPISPALVALAKGNLEVLSANLVVAFSTTVISLLVSGLAFVISMFRERVYMQDIGDIEYALELLEV
jgi:biopolymer transport protein ExbB/TolQ